MPIPIKKILLTFVGVTTLSIISYFIYQNIVYISTDNAQIEGHAFLLAPKVSGFILKVNAIQGKKVKKGDVLIEIDNRDYLNFLKQVKYNLISLNAKLTDSDNNFKRTEKLFKIGAATPQQYDSSLANLADLKAQKESLEAQLAEAELQLEYTKIKAPADGIISKTSAEVGQLASIGVSLIGFVDTEERWITANFKETEIEYIKNGESVQIEVDAYTNKTYKGFVYAQSSSTGATFTLLPPDNSTGNFTKVVQRVPVRIHFEKLTEQDIEMLKNGLSAFIKIKKNRMK
ncbi:MAG: HlyD family secretion protein [Silvanigrellaceae bacterium]|nr:HlyD family secretion protein [Silvanigrellaceae bacterium]